MIHQPKDLEVSIFPSSQGYFERACQAENYKIPYPGWVLKTRKIY